MTESQKRLRALIAEQSKARQRAVELSRETELTPETRAEMDTLEGRSPDLERQLRAARVAVEAEEAAVETREDDGEDAEIRALRDRSRVSSYMQAAVEQRAVGGAEGEFNAARKMPANCFPLELLAPRVEERTETNVDAQSTQTRWIDRVFSQASAMMLGVTFDQVAPGAASYPVTATGATAAQRGRQQVAADAAWTLSVEELKPTRNAVRAVYSNEDALRLPGLEDALRRDLGMALSDGVDKAIFVGDAGADENSADIVGLTTAAGVVEKTISQTNKIKAAQSLQAFVELVDGKHAAGVQDLRCVLTTGSHTLCAVTIANSAAENQTLLGFLKANGLMCSVRGDLEDNTADGDFGAFVGRARGIAGAAVAAVWSSAQLIVDPYTAAAKGEVALTLSYLWAFGLPRAANFARIKFGS